MPGFGGEGVVIETTLCSGSQPALLISKTKCWAFPGQQRWSELAWQGRAHFLRGRPGVCSNTTIAPSPKPLAVHM